MDYRVYDKKKKKWLDDVYMTQNGELLKPSQSFFGWTKPTFISENRYVYQMSIDLPDKNGTPVYVGDYIKMQVAEDKEITGLVTYANELASYVALCFETEEYFPLGQSVSEFIEVVSNVFDEDKKVKGNGKQSLQE